MGDCDICDEPITHGGKDYLFHTAELLREEKTKDGDVEKNAKIYRDVLCH